jgi:hypothetical protein
MTDYREYNTDCLFEATAIVQKTGTFPKYALLESQKIGENNKVIMMFAEVHNAIILDLKTGLLKVEPLAFKKIFLQLKRNVLRVSDMKNNGDLQDENSNPTA